MECMEYPGYVHLQEKLEQRKILWVRGKLHTHWQCLANSIRKDEQ